MKKLFVTLFVLWSICSLPAQSKIAPNFTVTDYKGNSIDLYADYIAKDKAVMIQLFFVACPPCNQIASDIQQMYRDNWDSGNGRVEFISLSVKSWDDNVGVQSFAEDNNISFPMVSAEGGSLSASQPYTSGQFGFYSGTPTFLVIGPDTVVHFGLDLDQVNDTLIAALEKKDTGEEICPDAFDIKIVYLANPILDTNNIIIQLESDIQGAKNYPLVRDTSSYFYDCSFELPPNPNDYYLRPAYDGDATKDVSTRDLVVILKHMLGKKLIQHNGSKIAADVNNNGKISTGDIAQIRKVILGRWDKFRMVNSHTFYDADDLFEDDTFPYTVPLFRSQIPLIELQEPEVSGTFNCVKMGDLTTIENRLADSETRSEKVLDFVIQDTLLQKGHYYSIPVTISQNEKILAFQAAIGSKDSSLEFLSIDYNASSPDKFSSFNPSKFEQTFLWFDADVLQSDYGQIMTLHFLANSDGLLSNQLILRKDLVASLYTEANELEGELKLKFITNNNQYKHEIILSPNPVIDGKLSVQLPLNTRGNKLEIFDTSGKLVFYQSVVSNNDRFELNLNHLGLQGVFFIHLLLEEGIAITEKVIFQ